jgi:hypothetical protein
VPGIEGTPIIFTIEEVTANFEVVITKSVSSRENSPSWRPKYRYITTVEQKVKKGDI